MAPHQHGFAEDLKHGVQFFSASLSTLLGFMAKRRETYWEADLLFQKSRLLIQTKEYGAAKETLELLLSLDASNGEAIVLLAAVMAEHNDLVRAAELYQKAIEINPYSTKANINYLITLKKMGSSVTFPVTFQNAAKSARLRCAYNRDVLFALANLQRIKNKGDCAENASSPAALDT